MRRGSLDDALAAGALAAARVDEDLLPAARAAEVALPGALDAGHADAIALHVARGSQGREAVAVDLGHVPEHVRADVVEGVEAHRRGHELDAGAGDVAHAADAHELGLVRREVGDGVARDVFLEQDLLVLALPVLGPQREEVLLQPGAFLEAHAEVVHQLGPHRHHVETRGTT